METATSTIPTSHSPKKPVTSTLVYTRRWPHPVQQGGRGRQEGRGGGGKERENFFFVYHLFLDDNGENYNVGGENDLFFPSPSTEAT